jgi:DNA-binding MarR family transcriptional regulator
VDVETLGHTLFGRRLRLRVLLWVLNVDGGTFFLTEAAQGIGYSASGVRDELERLVDLGMLRRDAGMADRRVYYTRTGSPLWRIIDATRLALLPQADPYPARTDDDDAH